MPHTVAHMTAETAAVTAAPSTRSREPMVGVLRGLLLAEAAGGLVLTIFLSMAASVVSADAEVPLRFAAGGVLLIGIFAAIASRGARRRRSWSWTLAAILQVIIAIAAGIAVLNVEWHPVYLAPFGFAVAVMLVLSTTSVRRALGQE